MKDKQCTAEIPALFRPLTNRRIDLKDYFRMDDYSCLTAFYEMTESDDPILSDLSRRVRDRDLFAYTDSNPAVNRRIRSELRSRGLDLNYYWEKDAVEQSAYVPYTGSDDGLIWVRMKDGTTRELSTASGIVDSLIHGPVNDDNKVFFPREVEACVLK